MNLRPPANVLVIPTLKKWLRRSPPLRFAFALFVAMIVFWAAIILYPLARRRAGWSWEIWLAAFAILVVPFFGMLDLLNRWLSTGESPPILPEQKEESTEAVALEVSSVGDLSKLKDTDFLENRLRHR